MGKHWIANPRLKIRFLKNWPCPPSSYVPVLNWIKIDLRIVIVMDWRNLWNENARKGQELITICIWFRYLSIFIQCTYINLMFTWKSSKYPPSFMMLLEQARLVFIIKIWPSCGSREPWIFYIPSAQMCALTHLYEPRAVGTGGKGPFTDGNRPTHTTYRKNNNLEKWAGMGLNGFHIKLIIGTHCNWKNQNPGSHLEATS